MLFHLNLIFILICPLIATIVAGFFGRFFGASTIGKFSIYLLGLSAILSGFSLYLQSISSFTTILTFGKWFNTFDFDVEWSLIFDSVSCTMCFVITFISFLVHFYSLGYLSNDPSITRFLSYLSLFTFFMLLFVLSANLIQMFIGWEGVGLVSYLLINFWYDRVQANRAALKAIVMNRIGDFFFLIAILLLWAYFGIIDVYSLSGIIDMEYTQYTTFFGMPISKITLITGCLLIAAFVKSAQFGFHTWLADAMEGPTPVSALLHAATMVTAGVYLIIRTSVLFGAVSNVNLFMLIIASITTFFASFVAFFQYDLKKIIAYSTCAQLGLMFVACALNQYVIALFHLFNHAFFKALLFLCAGIIIHGANDEQDIRKFGNFKEFFPITYKGFLIASLSLMGFPGLTGFYSKDPIFEVLLFNTTSDNLLSILFVSLGTFFTAAYSIRVLILVFYNKYAGSNGTKSQIHETNDKYLLMPILVLTILSLVGGSICAPYFLNPESSIFKKTNLVSYVNTDFLHIEELPWFLKLLPFILTILGSLFGIICMKTKLFSKIIQTRLVLLLNTNQMPLGTFIHYNNYITAILRVFHFDNIYYTFIVKPITFLSYSILYKNIEKGLLEYFGPTGISKLIKSVSVHVYNYNKVNLSTILLTLFLIVLLIIFLWFLAV